MLQLKITIYNSRASVSLHSINPFNTTREKNTRNKHLSFPSIQFQSFPLQFETIIPYTCRISRSSSFQRKRIRDEIITRKGEKDGKRNFVLPRFLIVRPQFLLSGLLIKVRASTSGGPGFRFIVFLSALLATGHAIMRAGHLYFLLHFVTRRYLDRVFLDRAPWEPVTLWHLEKGRGWTVREKG